MQDVQNKCFKKGFGVTRYKFCITKVTIFNQLKKWKFSTN